MSAAPAQPSARPRREFRYTRADFQQLRELAARHAGIQLASSKHELVYARLARRLRRLGLDSFEDYCRLLTRADPAELEAFTNALTTNLTAFFREPHHFEFLRTVAIPAWIAARGGGRDRRLRLWCAGCSTGEEAYSLAITALEALPRAEARALILATDVDSGVLRVASRGVYSLERTAGLSEAVRRRWFLRGVGPREGQARVAPALRRLVRFERHNLVQQGLPDAAPFDIVFCRNVTIYFDRLTQERLLDGFRRALRPGGYLVLGHAESVTSRNPGFEAVARSVYRRSD